MPGLTQYSGVVLPSSINANFAGRFGQLCELTLTREAPFGIPKLGTDAPRPTPLLSLLTIAMSEKAPVPGLTARQSAMVLESPPDISHSNFITDWRYFREILHGVSGNLDEVAICSADDRITRLYESKGYNTLAKFLHSTNDMPPDVLEYFTNSVGDIADHKARWIVEGITGKPAQADDIRPERFLEKISQEEHRVTTKEDLLNYATNRFRQGMLLAKTGKSASNAKPDEIFMHSAAVFAFIEHFSAAAMILERVSSLEPREREEPTVKALRNEADMWRKALKQSDALSFITAYPRALHSAWVAGHPGSGFLEEVFKAGMEQLIPRKDTDAADALGAILGAAWARLMKVNLNDVAEDLFGPIWAHRIIKPETLFSEDWIEVYNRLVTAEDFLSGPAFNMASGLREIIGEEIIPQLPG